VISAVSVIRNKFSLFNQLKNKFMEEKENGFNYTRKN
jgi:hypothetical protein